MRYVELVNKVDNIRVDIVLNKQDQGRKLLRLCEDFHNKILHNVENGSGQFWLDCFEQVIKSGVVNHDCLFDLIDYYENIKEVNNVVLGKRCA